MRTGVQRGRRLVGAGSVAAIAAASFLVHPTVLAQELRLEVAGAGEDLSDRVRGASVLAQTLSEGSAPVSDVIAAARAEYAAVLGALYAAGRYSATVSVRLDGREAADIPILEEPGAIAQVVVRVDPGRPFRFGSATVAPLASGTMLPDTFAPGLPAPAGVIREATSAAIEGWREIGHARADVAGQRIVADHARSILEADVRLSPGPKLRFGPLTVSGNRRVRTERIIAIAGLPSGEVFSPSVLRRAAERLRRTGAFRSVTLSEAERIGPGDLLGIAAEVEEEKKRRLGFGAEVAASEGITLSTYWLHRNLLGGAERLRFDAEVSGIAGPQGREDYDLSVRFERPATFTPDTALSASIRAARISDADSDQDLLDVGVGLAHVFSDSLSGRAELRYRTSEVTDSLGTTRYRSVDLPVSLIWDRRDDRFDPRGGFYVEATATPFAGFGSTGSGARLTGDFRVYRGFGAEDRVVLAGRLQLGSVFGPTLLGTPRDYLFYSGGGGTVRGQAYQSLGVNVLRAGQRTGGQHFVGLQTEARIGITEKIGAVAFLDAGAISAVDFGRIDDWHAGAGVGVRYDTGLGPIRADIGVPVAGGGSGFEVYIGIGQAF